MSVDRLLAELPVDGNFAYAIEATKIVQDAERKNTEIPRERSLIAVFAQELVRSGQIGLKRIYRDYQSGHRVPTDQQILTQIETAAIFLGGAILELEAGLQTEVIDMYSLVNNVNSPLRDTNLESGCRLPENSTVMLTTREWRGMAECLTEDPTFATFFTKPRFLPDELGSYLDEETVFGVSFLKCINTNNVLQDYTKRAHLLVSKKHNPMAV